MKTTHLPIIALLCLSGSLAQTSFAQEEKPQRRESPSNRSDERPREAGEARESKEGERPRRESPEARERRDVNPEAVARMRQQIAARLHQIEEQLQQAEKDGRKEDVTRLRRQLEETRAGIARREGSRERDGDARRNPEREHPEAKRNNTREGYEERPGRDPFAGEHRGRGEHDGDRGQDRRGGELERKIHHLMQAAENLHAAGMPKEAEYAQRQANVLREQLERSRHHDGPEGREASPRERELQQMVEHMKREMNEMRELIADLRRELERRGDRK